MLTCGNHDMKDLIKEYKALGWKVEKGGKHLKFIPPNGGQIVFCPATPSDHRSVKNTRAFLRRASKNPST